MKRMAQTVAAALVILGVTLARGDDLEQVKARMLARRPAMIALLAQQKAGENNQGYLAARGDMSADEQKLLADENAERRQVYEEIASRTKAPVKQVGAQRAEAIARQVKAGTWLQAADGKWARKP